MPIRVISKAGNGPRVVQSETDQHSSTAEKESKAQPTRKLPTDRIAFQKQLDILRAYGNGSQSGTKAVSPKEVADMVKMSATTVPLMNTFMVDNGFVEKSGADFIPNRALVEFSQAYNWMPETAARKLAPLLRRTWFGERLVTRLGFRPMSVEEAIADLGGQINAGPEFKAQIDLLLDYTVAAGLIRRDGTQLALGEEGTSPNPNGASAAPEKSAPIEPREMKDDTVARGPANVSTGFMNADGAVQFHVSIKVSMQEVAGWSPDRISAFFTGLAKVIAAKNGSETIEKG